MNFATMLRWVGSQRPRKTSRSSSARLWNMIGTEAVMFSVW